MNLLSGDYLVFLALHYLRVPLLPARTMLWMVEQGRTIAGQETIKELKFSLKFCISVSVYICIVTSYR
jgi:hypothetical protein